MTTITNNRKQDLWQKDKDHFVHPWTHFASFKEHGSLIMEKGERSTVEDIDGKKYIDGIAGLWCVNIGYGRPEMGQVSMEQMNKLCYYSTFVADTTEPAAELSAKLAQLAPGNLNRVFYSLSGSCANDTSVRIVHHYNIARGKPEKKHIISRKDAYHGSTYIAMSLTGIAVDHVGWSIEDNWIHHISSPSLYRRPEGAEGLSDEEYVEFLAKEFEDKILEIGADKVAAFIAEPIMGAGGVITAPDGYHKRMWEVCQKYDMKYISDEVVTSFGRLGHMFASQDVFGVTPDIINTAKGLTSGYIPLAASIISDEIYEVVSNVPEDRLFTHGFTYSGHPVACAVALKNIEIIEEENICEYIQEVGPYLEKRVKELKDLPLVGDVRGSKFMLCIESVFDKETKELFPFETDIGGRVTKYCQEEGVLIRPIGHKNVLSPPLVLTVEEIDIIVDTVRASIEKVQQDLRDEGIWNG